MLGSYGQTNASRQQATGIERFELIGKAEGVDVFDMSPLESTRIGTLEDPIEIFSYVSGSFRHSVSVSNARLTAVPHPSRRMHRLPRRLARHHLAPGQH